MVKRSTLILIVIFLALGTFFIYQQNKPETTVPDADSTPTDTVAPVEFLFPEGESAVTSILIESRDGESLSLARVSTGWMMKQPDSAAADPAAVEAAASQLTAISIKTRLELDSAAAGVNDPAFTITVGYSNGKFLTAQIGDEIPTGTGYYARKDDGSIVVVSKDSIDILTSMLEFLPYAETPTPSPTLVPSETATSTPAATDAVTPIPVTKTP